MGVGKRFRLRRKTQFLPWQRNNSLIIFFFILFWKDKTKRLRCDPRQRMPKSKKLLTEQKNKKQLPLQSYVQWISIKSLNGIILGELFFLIIATGFMTSLKKR